MSAPIPDHANVPIKDLPPAEDFHAKTVQLSHDMAKFLDESGLMFFINQQVLHPMGMALAVNEGDHGEYRMEKIYRTDDPEGYVFGKETFEEGDAKLQKFLQSIDYHARLTRREMKLGYYIQTEPDQE